MVPKIRIGSFANQFLEGKHPVLYDQNTGQGFLKAGCLTVTDLHYSAVILIIYLKFHSLLRTEHCTSYILRKFWGQLSTAKFRILIHYRGWYTKLQLCV